MATYAIDTGQTFRQVMLMASGPRMKFGSSTEQDVTSAGEKKYEIQAAVTFTPEYGMRPQSEIISVTCTGVDPGHDIAPGNAIEFVNLRLGIMAPEQRDNGRGVRVVGGKPYFSCTGIRAVHAQRQPVKAEA